MTRALRKRIQRLLSSPPPAIHRKDPKQEIVDTLYQKQYLRVLGLLSEATPETCEKTCIALAHSLHEASDEAWQAAAGLFPEGIEQMQCREGCSHCCNEPLGVNILDAIALAAARQSNPLDYTLDTRDRWQLKALFQPCPMLKDGRCSVYHARPVICRAYHSSNVGRCQEVLDTRDSGRQVPMDLMIFGYTGLPQEATLKVFEEVGIDRRPVVLGLAVAALGEDFEGMTRDWLSGGSAFDDVVVQETGPRPLQMQLPVVG
jgi:hypothetical protein